MVSILWLGWLWEYQYWAWRGDNYCWILTKNHRWSDRAIRSRFRWVTCDILTCWHGKSIENRISVKNRHRERGKSFRYSSGDAISRDVEGLQIWVIQTCNIAEKPIFFQTLSKNMPSGWLTPKSGPNKLLWEKSRHYNRKRDGTEVGNFPDNSL